MVQYVCNQCGEKFFDSDVCGNCHSWDIDIVRPPDEDDDDIQLEDEIPVDIEKIDENGDDTESENEIEEIDDSN
jgi:hypothetical protein